MSMLLVAAAVGGVTVTPGFGELTVTGFAPNIGLPVTVRPGVGALTVTGFAVTIQTPVTVQPATGALVLEGFAAAIQLPVTVLSGVGALDLSGFAPSVQTPAVVLPGVGDLHLTGFEPTIVTSTALTVEPGFGELELIGFAPTIEIPVPQVTHGGGGLYGDRERQKVRKKRRARPVTVEPGVGELAVVGYAPTIEVGTTVPLSEEELLEALVGPPTMPWLGKRAGVHAVLAGPRAVVSMPTFPSMPAPPVWRGKRRLTSAELEARDQEDIRDLLDGLVLTESTD